MKKRLSKVIKFCMLLVCMCAVFVSFGCIDSYAADNVECTIQSDGGKIGGEVIIRIKVTKNPGTIMSETKFTYDKNVLEIKSVKSHDLFAGDVTQGMVSDWTQPSLTTEPISMMDGYFTVRGNTSNTGDLYTIKARIKDNASFGTTKVGFSGRFLDWELNDYPIVCEDAEINIRQGSKKNHASMVIMVIVIITAVIVISVVLKRKTIKNDVNNTV